MKAEAILDALLDRLWEDYKTRVSYARKYNEMVIERGGRMTNDHIALRTFNHVEQGQPKGIASLARIFTALGYYKDGEYIFKDKMLYAEHFLHKDLLKPKIFISQLEVNQLPTDQQKLIHDAVKSGKDPLNLEDLDALKRLQKGESLDTQHARKLGDHLHGAFRRVWLPPLRSTIAKTNEVSQYAAWTLLHGNSINHFTANINEQNVTEWKGDIEITMAALKKAGIPIKDEIEGAPGTKLRQSSTTAVIEQCPVREADGSTSEIEWTYAYYELLERNPIIGPDGKKTLFTGFLGDQATNLFEMTDKKKATK